MTFDKRFYGIYQGVCIDNIDPNSTYKIKLQVPQVLGSAVTEWAPGCLPVGATSVPAIGQVIWVMFIAGDPNFPVWIGVRP
jgi:hypothetical protein